MEISQKPAVGGNAVTRVYGSGRFYHVISTAEAGGGTWACSTRVSNAIWVSQLFHHQVDIIVKEADAVIFSANPVSVPEIKKIT